MFIHEASTRESNARVVESLGAAKRDVFHAVDVMLNSDKDLLHSVMSAMDQWSSLLELQEGKQCPGQVMSMSRATIAAELSTNRHFLGMITL